MINKNIKATILSIILFSNSILPFVNANMNTKFNASTNIDTHDCSPGQCLNSFPTTKQYSSIIHYLSKHLNSTNLEQCLGIGMCFKSRYFPCQRNVGSSDIILGVNSTGCLGRKHFSKFHHWFEIIKIMTRDIEKCTNIDLCLNDKYLPCGKNIEKSQLKIGLNITDCLKA